MQSFLFLPTLGSLELQKTCIDCTHAHVLCVRWLWREEEIQAIHEHSYQVISGVVLIALIKFFCRKNHGDFNIGFHIEYNEN